MIRVPLNRRLKRQAHREVAFAQDVLLAEAYDAYPGCVLHGGTAIWRCYGGTRFSEDLDAYLPDHTDGSDARLRRGLAAKGVRELKFRRTANSVFGKFEIGGGVVRFDGALREPPARALAAWETIDGGSVIVSALPADDLLAEKAAAYADRRKVRDLYDVLFLLGKAEDEAKVAVAVKALLSRYRPPVDEASLKALVVTGAAPSPREMVEALERWARRYT